VVHSHRFAAANTALPVAFKDDEQLQAVVDFLKAGQVTVDLFALVRGEEPTFSESTAGTPEATAGRQIASTFAVGEEAEMVAPVRPAAPLAVEEIVAPLDQRRPTLFRGESVRIDAVVRTRNVGHFFPGGTVDAFDTWLELKAEDNQGKTIFWSGSVEDNGKGPVEPGAHFYRSLLLDGNGNPITKRNAWAARSVLYVRLIPPGAANTVRFRLQVPVNSGSEITLTAKLNYRKFAWWNTQWAYAGERDPSHQDFALGPHYDDGRWLFTGSTANVSGALKEIPNLPIVTMAEAKVSLPVMDAEAGGASLIPPDEADDALRWNDYGIGLLLQGDLRAAENAFLRVTTTSPDYADGWVNVARVRVQEGDPEGARQVLDKALELEPDLAKAHYFYGLTLKADGRYDEARHDPLFEGRYEDSLRPQDLAMFPDYLVRLKRREKSVAASAESVTAPAPPSRFIDATVSSPFGAHAGLNSPRATPVLGGPASSASAANASLIAPIARSTTRATIIGVAPLSADEYASVVPSGE